MFQSLKKKYFILTLLLTSVLWAAAAALLICNADNIKILFEKPVDLYDLDAEGVREGVCIKADISFIYDYYCYYEEDNSTAWKEYLIPVGNEEYMSLVCKGSDMTEADKIMQLCWDYFDGKDVSVDSFQDMHVTGTIMPLEGESLRFYHQYIDALDWTEEEKQHFLPYTLKVGNIGNESVGSLVFYGICFLLLFVLGGILLMNGITGGNIKVVEKYCSEKGDKDTYMQRIEAFYNAGVPVQGIRINTEYFLAVKGMGLYFSEIGNLLWVYSSVITHRVYFIPTAKTYSIIVKMADGKQFNVQMKNEAAANEAIEYISKNMPYLIVGYDDEIMKLYNKNRAELVRTVAERRQEYLGTLENEV